MVLRPALLPTFGSTTAPVDARRFATVTSYLLRRGSPRMCLDVLPVEAPSTSWAPQARRRRWRHERHRQVLEAAARAPQGTNSDLGPHLDGHADRAPCAPHGHRFLPDFGARCESALPAAVLAARPVRPSRSTFDAARAADALVFLDLAMGQSPSVVDVYCSVRMNRRGVNSGVRCHM